MNIDVGQIVSSLIGSGPVALVLFYWVQAERKERRELQTVLLAMLEKTASLGETTRDALKDLRSELKEKD
jgi:hypothetical protein